MWSHRRPVFFVIPALCLVACSAARASPAWLGTAHVGANVVGAPSVALAPGGELVVAWESGNVVVAASRPPGGQFTSAKTLSQLPSDEFSMRVAVSKSGRAVVAWLQRQPAFSARVAAAVRAPDGTWGPPIPLSAEGADASAVNVEMSDTGEAVVTWVRAGRVQASRRAPGAQWTAAEDVSPFGIQASAPVLDMTPQGHAVVFWIHSGGVAGANRPPGDDWRAEPGVPATSASKLAAAVGADGTVGVLWLTDAFPLTFNVVTRPRTSGWRTPEPLGGPNQGFDGGAIAVDGRGIATAVWPGTTVGGVSTTRTTGPGWSDEPALVRVGLSDAYTPDVAASPLGHVVAAWPGQILPAATGYVQAATHGPGGAWSVVQGLGTEAQVRGTAVAIDERGNAVTAWSGDAAGTAVRAFDASGPDFTSLTVPAGATTGAPVDFASVARDRWSPLATTRWSFGDSTGQSGTRARHAYRTAGRYPVTVTATDSLGNASSVQRSILVTDPPDGSPPKQRRFLKIPYKGGYSLPDTVPLRLACRGTVKLTLKLRRTTLQRRSAHLNRKCRFRTQFRVRRTRLAGVRKLRVIQRWAGNRFVGKSVARVTLHRMPDGTFRRRSP
jgi:PKD domain-containing protein